jgi:excinuclease ABC subunit C
MKIYNKVIEFPESPGVYLMKNNAGNIIYIGKAKNLKNRVSSYFNRTLDSEKTIELVKKICDIEYIICKSEIDALILENNLIKKHKPKYNINLKDEKTYPYIKITKEKFPKLSIVRSTKYLEHKNAVYFGPYPQGIYNYVKILKKIFPIRDCNRDMNKIYDRPCLKYYMKLCLGPCVYKNLEAEYNNIVENLVSFLKGNVKNIINEYKEEMNSASEVMDFEKAIAYRERIFEIEKIETSQISELGRALDEDIFVFGIEAKRLFICVISVRDGKIIGKQSNNNSIEGVLVEDLFLNIVTLYYMKHPIPKNIIFDEKYASYGNEIKKWSLLFKDKNINVYFPKIKSRRKELVDMAYSNLERDIDNYFKSKKVLEEGLLTLYKELSLKNFPDRIECFDISNTQGTNPVAAMTVSIKGKNAKKEYRKFKIRTKSTPDDFEMMREAIYRRYSKLEKDKFPNLILIDGGKGQLGAVGGILYELGVLHLVDVIGIAKREEEIFKLGESEPYIFSKKDEALKILQRLRDEAHRFGITFHRSLRNKRVISSALDRVEGIGPKRKEILLKEFKSVKKIKESSIEELKKFIPENVAIKLKNTLEGDENNQKNISNR